MEQWQYFQVSSYFDAVTTLRQLRTRNVNPPHLTVKCNSRKNDVPASPDRLQRLDGKVTDGIEFRHSDDCGPDK